GGVPLPRCWGARSSGPACLLRRSPPARSRARPAVPRIPDRAGRRGGATLGTWLADFFSRPRRTERVTRPGAADPLCLGQGGLLVSGHQRTSQERDMSTDTTAAAPERAETAGNDGTPPFRYGAALAAQIERRWQDRSEREGTFHAPNPAGPWGEPGVVGRDKVYLLDMFPYPSGAGLHVGHPLGFIGTDVLGRYLRMNGRTVLHAMGFDAFGLPAEQYAVQ